MAVIDPDIVDPLFGFMIISSYELMKGYQTISRKIFQDGAGDSTRILFGGWHGRYGKCLYILSGVVCDGAYKKSVRVVTTADPTIKSGTKRDKPESIVNAVFARVADFPRRALILKRLDLLPNLTDKDGVSGASSPGTTPSGGSCAQRRL